MLRNPEPPTLNQPAPKYSYRVYIERLVEFDQVVEADSGPEALRKAERLMDEGQHYIIETRERRYTPANEETEAYEEVCIAERRKLARWTGKGLYDILDDEERRVRYDADSADEDEALP